MRRLLAPVPIAVVCVAGALLALLAHGLAETEPDRQVDEALSSGRRNPAPPLELPRLSGNGVETLASYKGEVVVLNFWASWCEPCRNEWPLLQRWHKRMERRDGEGLSRETFAIVGFPETFVLDRSGRIAAVKRGPVDEQFMRDRVVPLLRERA